MLIISSDYRIFGKMRKERIRIRQRIEQLKKRWNFIIILSYFYIGISRVFSIPRPLDTRLKSAKCKDDKVSRKK